MKFQVFFSLSEDADSLDIRATQEKDSKHQLLMAMTTMTTTTDDTKSHFFFPSFNGQTMHIMPESDVPMNPFKVNEMSMKSNFNSYTEAQFECRKNRTEDETFEPTSISKMICMKIMNKKSNAAMCDRRMKRIFHWNVDTTNAFKCNANERISAQNNNHLALLESLQCNRQHGVFAWK